RDAARVGDDRDVVLRRLARPRFPAADLLVPAEAHVLHWGLLADARIASASPLRPADGLRVEVSAAARAAERARHRRGRRRGQRAVPRSLVAPSAAAAR